MREEMKKLRLEMKVSSGTVWGDGGMAAPLVPVH